MGNAATAEIGQPLAEPKRLAFFERYLTVWVFLCMVVGVMLGKALPGETAALIGHFQGRRQSNQPVGGGAVTESAA